MFLQKYKDILAAYIPNVLAKKFTSGAIWSLGGAIISRGLNLLATIIVARLIGKEVFGEYSIIQNTLTTAATVAGLGLGMTGTKYVASFKNIDFEKVRKIIQLILVLSVITGLLGTVIVYFSSDYIAVYILNAARLKGLLCLGSIMIIFSVIVSAINGILMGLDEFKQLAYINFLVGVFNFLALLILTYEYGLAGAVISLSLSMLINFSLCVWVLKRNCKINQLKMREDGFWSEYRIITKFGIPAVFGNLIVVVGAWFTNIMIVNQVNGYAELAVMNAALQWQNIILFIPGTFTPVILSMLSNKYGDGQQDVKSYWRIVKLSFSINFIISGTLCVIAFFLSDYLMSIYGAGFSNYGLILRLIVVSAFLISVNNVVGQVIASMGSMWYGLLFNLLWAIVFFTSSFYGIRHYGVIGLAWAYIISYLLHSIWQYGYIYYGWFKKAYGN